MRLCHLEAATPSVAHQNQCELLLADLVVAAVVVAVVVVAAAAVELLVAVVGVAAE